MGENSNMKLPANCHLFVSNHATSGKRWWVFAKAPIGCRQSWDVRTWDEVASAMEERWKDTKCKCLVLIGHGSANGGGSAIDNYEGVMDVTNLTQEQIDRIKAHIAPNGYILLLGCCQCMGGSEGTCGGGSQKLADRFGLPVIGNTGTISCLNKGEGKWVRYDPRPPVKK